jgi:hypothetical protein
MDLAASGQMRQADVITEGREIVDADFRNLVWAAMRGGAASRPQPPDILARLRELGRPAAVQECLRELFPDRLPLQVADAFARGITDGDIVELPELEDGTIRYVANRRCRRRLDPDLVALIRPVEPKT